MVIRAEKEDLPGQVLAGGHRATCCDTTRDSFIREEGPGGLEGCSRPRAAEPSTWPTQPAPACPSAPTVEIYFLPGGQIVHERPCNEKEGVRAKPGPLALPPAQQLSPVSATMTEMRFTDKDPWLQGSQGA